MKIETVSLVSTYGSVELDSYIINNSPEIDEKRLRPAIIICPGGGYEFTSDRESDPIAIRYLSMGCQAFVLHYHIKPAVYPQSMVELALAVKYVRENSKQLHVHPDKIILAGFSAGGHLVASLGVFWQSDLLKKILGDCSHKWRPNGLILSYPVITSGDKRHDGSFQALLGTDYEEKLASVSLENNVTKYTPTTFLWHTLEDDLVPVENSLLFAQALRQKGVSFELHIFPHGGHGLSTGQEETAMVGGYGVQKGVDQWLKLCKVWIDQEFRIYD